MIKKTISGLKFSNFARKEDGNVFIATAVIAPLLVLAVGVGVDTAEVYRAKINFQNAVDAGALMAAKVIAAEGGGSAAKAKAKRAGKNVFHANMRNLDPSKASIDFVIDSRGCAAGGITAVATADHRVFFDTFHKASDLSGRAHHVKLKGETEVKCGNTTLEVALVLDNSGSMRSNPGSNRLPSSPGPNAKINTLKTAAKDMVNTLHDSFGQLSGVSEPLQFSIVPFASMVNVGSNNKNKSWMDTDGLSSIHHENFDWDLDPNAVKAGDGYQDLKGNPLSRFTLYNNLGLSWKGCVESRPYPLLLSDDAPNAGTPDTLFVPGFSPDTPSRWNIRFRWEEFYRNDYLNDAHNFPAQLNSFPTHRKYTGASGGKQHKRQKWTWKYSNLSWRTRNYLRDVDRQGYGPNEFCTSIALSQLTASRRATLAKLNEMRADGATNIQQGAAWGWRTLSSGSPFTEGRQANAANNRKIMIMMTDGENTYYPSHALNSGVSERNISTYGAYGLAVNKRIFARPGGYFNYSHTLANYTTSMNTHLSDTCTNIKADGVEIYTIAFDVDANSPTRNLLTTCASTGPTGKPLYYSAENSADLTNTFKEIANTLSALKISR